MPNPVSAPVAPAAAAPPAVADPVAALRAFNRFYTRRIGALHEHLLDSRFTLAESRLLWELAHRDGASAAELARGLGLDPGYLSRLLAALKARKLVRGERAAHDARLALLHLTAAGRKAFAPLDERSQAQTAALLAGLNAGARHRLLQAAGTIEAVLGAGTGPAAAEPWLLRPHAPGDIGWIVARHGALYAQEYGWDMRFEALVARIGAEFIERLDPRREACWIAEREGRNVGCVLLVQARREADQTPEPGVAQLRLLLVEPAARGAKIGERLVAQCTRFAREANYRRIRLWTNSILVAARSLYARAGYTLTASQAHHSFGHALVGETWELALAVDTGVDTQADARAHVQAHP